LWRRVRRSFVAHAAPVTDADGRPIYVVWLNGHRLAHRDPDALLEAVSTVAAALATHDDVPATFAEYYFADVQDGYVDLDRSRARLHGDCKTRIQSNLKRETTFAREELIERFVHESRFRYPREVVESKLAELVGRDIREYKDGTLEWQRY
jgi:hypothetical protein